MTAVAIGLACIVVAALARDVALRVLAERNAARVAEAQVSALEHRIDSAVRGAGVEIDALAKRADMLETRVEVLAQKEQLRALGGKAQRS